MRNFNRFPNADIRINLAIFIEEISQKAEETLRIIVRLLEEGLRSEGQNRLLDRDFCMFLTMISGLLLSIEQFAYNKTNPQVAFTNSSFVLLNVEESSYSRDGQKPLENCKFISEEALSNCIKWLDLLQMDAAPIAIKFLLGFSKFCRFQKFAIFSFFHKN